MKKFLCASMVCWAIAGLALFFLVGCVSPAHQLAFDTERQVNRLANQVMYADRNSQIDRIFAGQKFDSNCETYSRTIADLLVENGADPEDVWLVNVTVPLRGVQVWDLGNGPELRRSMGHMVVIYQDVMIDNMTPRVTQLGSKNYDLRSRRNVAVGGWYPVPAEWK